MIALIILIMFNYFEIDKFQFYFPISITLKQIVDLQVILSHVQECFVHVGFFLSYCILFNCLLKRKLSELNQYPRKDLLAISSLYFVYIMLSPHTLIYYYYFQKPINTLTQLFCPCNTSSTLKFINKFQ